MKEVFVFGHQKPDTDSVASSIAVSYLMNKKQKEYRFVPKLLGKVNDETEYVLKTFNIKTPDYLNDVKVKVRNVNFRKDLIINQNSTIKEVYDFMIKEHTNGVPIVDDEMNLVNIVTLKEISTILMNNRLEVNTSLNNIVRLLDGEIVNQANIEINGEIVVTAYHSRTFIDNFDLHQNTILVVGDRLNIIEYAIDKKVKLIVINRDINLSDELLLKAKENNVNIIKTNYYSADVVHNLIISNYIKNYLIKREIISVLESDYLDKVRELAEHYSFTNYPVLDQNDKCIGLLRLNEIFDHDRQKVILVDHNEKNQSVEGIEEAEIIEVIDHHKIGNISTEKPINFRNMAVGCTCTIIYLMYEELQITIPYEIEALMLSAIISDTLLLKSPTATALDKYVLENLARSMGIDYEKYALKMFEAGSIIKGKKAKDLIVQDFKRIYAKDDLIGIGQLFVTDKKDIIKKEKEIIKALDEVKQMGGFASTLFFVTDIMENSSYMFYTKNMEENLLRAFKLDEIYQGIKLEGVLSRKKQIIPRIMETYV